MSHLVKKELNDFFPEFNISFPLPIGLITGPGDFGNPSYSRAEEGLSYPGETTGCTAKVKPYPPGCPLTGLQQAFLTLYSNLRSRPAFMSSLVSKPTKSAENKNTTPLPGHIQQRKRGWQHRASGNQNKII